MRRDEWCRGNRLPWRALIGGLALGAAVLAASGVESEDAAATPREVEEAVSAVDRLARRFGVPGTLAAIVYEEALRARVEPAMAFGVIATESGFDPNAIGRHGERGLMQIKPSTARAHDERVTAEQLHDPEVNVRLGLAHLKQEVEYFGDPILGLMSYHMGRARLERELADGVPPRDRYVDRVLSSCGYACA